jgi:tRNA-specific 2-thiouridylase
VKNNILYVNQGETDELYSKALVTDGFNFITEKAADGRYKARIRHRQPLQDVTFESDGKNARVTFDEKQRAVTAGQYCVIYDGQLCIGGGVISEKI